MFSRLPCCGDIAIPLEQATIHDGPLQMHTMTFDSWYSSSLYDQLDDPGIFDCFFNLPDVVNPPIVLDYTTLAREQLRDHELLQC